MAISSWVATASEFSIRAIRARVLCQPALPPSCRLLSLLEFLAQCFTGAIHAIQNEYSRGSNGLNGLKMRIRGDLGCRTVHGLAGLRDGMGRVPDYPDWRSRDFGLAGLIMQNLIMQN